MPNDGSLLSTSNRMALYAFPGIKNGNEFRIAMISIYQKNKIPTHFNLFIQKLDSIIDDHLQSIILY